MTARLLVATASAALLSAGAGAQSMPGMDMSHGHAHHSPAQAHSNAPTEHDAAPQQHEAHTAEMDHGAMPMPEPAAAHDRDGMGTAEAAAPSGTDLPAGNAPAPSPPRDHYADAAWGAEAMAASRATLARDHGGGTYSQVMFNIAEVQLHTGRDGYRWDGEAWFGGDINRLTVKSEGDGAFRGAAEHAEVQALYSRAIDPYWNLQAGLRYDVRPDPSHIYATIGIEGLAPYWFDVEAALFLSDKGDLLGRVEGYHDLRLTQRLVVQPRVELNMAAQDVPGQGIGSGLSDAELGLRLRYEVRREFAPYVGVSWARKVGDTARFARRQGDDVGGAGLVLGIRAWF